MRTWAIAISACLLLSACSASGSTAPGSAGGGNKPAASATQPSRAGGSVRAQGRQSRRGPGTNRAGAGFNLDAAAQYLGLDVGTLQQDLRDGKSLAQVAQEEGKDVAGLEQAMIAAAKASMDQAVSAGKMTADQEQAQLKNLQQRIDAMVNRSGRGRPNRPQQGTSPNPAPGA